MDPQRYRSLNFASLRDENLPTLYSWLQRPHVREFYHKKPVPAGDRFHAEYLQRLAPDWPTKCFVTHVGLTPIGYIQAYKVAHYPGYAATIQETTGISLDLFIGETEFVGQGWGRLILLKFMHEVAFPLFSGEHMCWIYHETSNHRALGASRAAGFKHARNFTEEGDQKQLMSVTNSEVAALVERLLNG